MPLKPLFGKFEPLIQARFDLVKADFGARVSGVKLDLNEDPYGKGQGRAEFLVIDPDGPVRITWNGIASLWAFAQGTARLARRTFDGKRKGLDTIEVKDDRELEVGLNSLELARRFCTQHPPDFAASPVHWPKWAPPIDPSAAPNTDDDTGNVFFLGALGWIFRHELAHVLLEHAKRQSVEGLTTRACELEADLKATEMLSVGMQPDEDRIAGVPPEKNELQLELRSIFVGLGLSWVALYEADLGRLNADYPPIAERIHLCVSQLKLREDSAGAEILHDVIHSWIAPEASWAPGGSYPTALEAFNEAVIQLHLHMRASR